MDITIAMVWHLAGFSATPPASSSRISYQDCLSFLHDELVFAGYDDHHFLGSLRREANTLSEDAVGAFQSGIDALKRFMPEQPSSSAVRATLNNNATSAVTCACVLLAEHLLPSLRDIDGAFLKRLRAFIINGRHEVRLWLCAV